MKIFAATTITLSLFISGALNLQAKTLDISSPVSQEYFFASDLLRALHYCQWVLDQQSTIYEKGSATRKTLQRQNNRLMEAKNLITTYDKEPNKTVQLLVKNLLEEVNIVLQINKRLIHIQKLKESAKKSPTNFKRKHKKSRDLIAAYVGYIYSVLRQPGDNDQRSGSMALNITYDESVALLDQIDLYFGKDMRNHPENWVALQKGFQKGPFWKEKAENRKTQYAEINSQRDSF